MAAVLRSQPTGNLQKLLADGIAFAPDLAQADLQRTNLQNAYLGNRVRTARLDGADLFRADLSGASLKGAEAGHAQFYEARLCRAVLSGATLAGANFANADLAGAVFKGANLAGARFGGARHVPAELVPHIVDGTYASDQPAPGPPPRRGGPARVFISVPSQRARDEQAVLDSFFRALADHGLEHEELVPGEYPSFGALAEVKRRMATCSAAAVFGFRQVHIDDAVVLPGRPGSAAIKDTDLPTPWNHIEAGMAFTLDLPLLVITPPGASHGIFDRRISEQSVHHLPLERAGAGVLPPEWVSAALDRAGRG